MLRVIGKVLLREAGGLSVLSDVRPVEPEVARVPGPLPVVGLAPEVPDPLPGCVDEPDVVDLQLGDLEVALPLEEGGDPAAEAALLAAGRPLLRPALDPVEALAVRGLRRDLAEDLVGDFLDRDRDEDPGAGAVPELLSPALRQEPVLDQVPVGSGVVLERPLDAVVVRDDQAVRGDEGRAAAAEGDDGPHREAGQVCEGAGVPGEAEALQAGRERGDLLRHPHPLVRGKGGNREKGERAQQEGSGKSRLQGNPPVVPK